MKEAVKIDLHCHLDGSLSKRYMEKQLGRSVPEEELRAPENCQSLREYLTRFDLPLDTLQTKEGLYEAAKDFLLSAAKEQMDYIEVRFAPALSRRQGLSYKQIMEAVLDGFRSAEKACKVRWNVIVCAMRHLDTETNLQMLKECREFLGAGVGGADLAGDEAGFPTAMFGEVFAEAGRLGYPFTIHAGECGSVQSVLDAVSMGAARIGHGIALRGNPEAMKLCADRKIGIELCPISNYQTKALQAGDTYPLREFLRHGLCTTINTDNRTVSHTTLDREYEFLKREHQITEEEILLCQKHAIEAAFAADEVKQELLKKFIRLF